MVNGGTSNTSNKLTKGSSFETMNDDLDKRIAEIRKKYQDYTESTVYTQSKTNYSRPSTGYAQDKYKNYVADRSYRLNESEPFKEFNENLSTSYAGGTTGNLKVRKMVSDYEKYENFGNTDLKSRFENTNDYRFPRARQTNMGLRKIMSYQDY